MIECPISYDEVLKMMHMIKKNAIENDIIIIDSLKSFSSYFDVNIEYNDEMYTLMIELKTIVKKTGCSIILVHHVFRPKNIKSHVDSFYGSRAIEEQCDSGFMYSENEVEIVKSRLGYSRGMKLQI
jgi:RecA-family ATPase